MSRQHKRTYINPQTIYYSKMSLADKRKEYTRAVKSANRRLAAIKEEGLDARSEIYQYMIQQGNILKTGNVGFSQKGYSKWNESKLKMEYEKVYNVLQAPSSSISKKQKEKMMAKNLSFVGIDFLDMKDNPKYKKELDEFYKAYGQAYKNKVFEELNLDKYEAFEAIIEFLQENPNARGKSSYNMMMRHVNRKLEEIRNISKKDDQHDIDQYRIKIAIEDYESNKDAGRLGKITDALLYKLVKKKFGNRSSGLGFIDKNGEQKDWFLS